MIRLYSGTPGSGKSLHNARDIIMRSKFGEPVIGNFECDLHQYKKSDYTYCPNDKLTPQFLREYSRKYFKGRRPGAKDEGSILLVIDECQLLFNSREWQRNNRNQWLEFFTQHRKLGYDITLIAQFDRMIDRQIRSLIEYEYIHRKLSNFGLKGWILSVLMGGNTFVAVKIWYPLKERLGAEFIHARKKLWTIYDSYALFDTDAEGVGVGGPRPSAPVTECAEDSEEKKTRFAWYQNFLNKNEPRFAKWLIKEKRQKKQGKFEKKKLPEEQKTA